MSQTEDAGTINKWVNAFSAAVEEAAGRSGLSPADTKLLAKFLTAKTTPGSTVELTMAYGEGGESLFAQKASSILVGSIAAATVASSVGPFGAFVVGTIASQYVDENWEDIQNPLPAFDEQVAPELLDRILGLQQSLAGFFRELEEGAEASFNAIESAIEEFIAGFEVTMLEGALGISEWLDEGVFGFLDVSVASQFVEAQSWTRPRRSDPLALDLDGDGIETTGIGNWGNTTLFDHDGDGNLEGTGWLSGDDGWLARDIDGNGTIDSGAELFGEHTRLAGQQAAVDGFSALAALDSNADGSIDRNDNAFEDLLVWQDGNQDGVSQAGELKSLAELGISALSLDATESAQSQNGNLISALSHYSRADGTSGQLGNIDLAESDFFTEFSALPDADPDLPDVHGSGAVRNLRDAASLSPTLSSLVADYAEANRSTQMAQLDGLLLEWASTSGMQSMVERAEEEGFLVLYEFGNLNGLTDAEAVDSAVTVIQNGDAPGPAPGGRAQFIAEAMDSQTRVEYRHWFRMINVLERFNGQEFVSFDRPTVTNPSLTIEPSDPVPGTSGTVGGFDLVRIRIDQAQLDLLQRAYDALRDSVYDSLLVQTRLASYINAVAIDIGDHGVEMDFSGVNELFDHRFLQNDVDAAWDLADLYRTLGERLTENGWTPLAYLANHLSDLDAGLSDESVAVLSTMGIGVVGNVSGGSLSARVDIEDLVGRNGADELTGTAAENLLIGGGGDDRLMGEGGDDRIEGGDGNDTLDGGRGADALDGGAGNDTLTTHYNHGGNRLRGGAGDDHMTGSYRDDTYLYRRGDGRDVIRELYHYSGTDTLVFEQVNHDMLWFERSGNDLVISELQDDGRITIDNWYGGAAHQVERLETADGRSLSNAAVDQLVAAMAGFSPADGGEGGAQGVVPEELQPTLAAAWQVG